MSGTRRVLSAVLFVLLLAASGREASAEPILYSTFTDLGGIFQYTYTVQNPADSNEAVYDVSLPAFAGDPEAVDPLGTPTGWTEFHGYNASTGLGFIDWASLLSVDPDTGEMSAPFDILPGQLLTGFVFTSLYGPGQIAYDLISYAIDDPMNVSTHSGFVVGPSAASSVPEPSTLLLLGAGMFGAWRMQRARQRA